MEERFLSKVDKNGAGGCWNWTGGLFDNKYGSFWLNRKSVLAHRVAYELWIGEIPEGLLIRHKCKQNPKCVNPAHLETGTHQENSNDMKRDGTSSKGSSHYKAKLNDDSVKEIRRLYGDTNITQNQLAKQFGVSKFAIGCVVNNLSWKHIT